MDNIFIEMIAENIDDLRSGKLPKGKFIGKYVQKLNEMDRENAFRYKHPQIAGNGKDPSNNWLDYILSLNDEEFKWFKTAITN